MAKRLNQIVIGTGIVFSLLATPYISYSQITGGTTRGSKQDENWENKSSKNDPRIKKWGAKILEKSIDYIDPSGGLINKSIKAGKWAGERQREKGYGTGTSSTTDEYED